MSKFIVFLHMCAKLSDNSDISKFYQKKSPNIVETSTTWSRGITQLIHKRLFCSFFIKKDKGSLISIIICIFAAEKTKIIDKYE